jgi:hypothetical protein
MINRDGYDVHIPYLPDTVKPGALGLLFMPFAISDRKHMRF